MKTCPYCGVQVDDGLTKCRSCGKEFLVNESLRLTKTKKKGKETSNVSTHTQIEYEPPFEGSQLEALKLVYFSPSSAKSVFFSSNRPPLLPLLVVISVITITYVSVLTSKTEWIFINGSSIDTTILTIIFVLTELGRIGIQLVISSVVFGYAFKLGFKPGSLGYHKSISTFLRLNIYRLVVHSAFTLLKLFFLLSSPNSKQIIDVATNEKTVTVPFPDWFILWDGLLTAIPFAITSVIIFMVMTKTFEMSRFNALIASLFSIFPVIQLILTYF